jgi:hypothetical protein
MQAWDFTLPADRVAWSKAKAVMRWCVSELSDEIGEGELRSMRPRERDKHLMAFVLLS